MPRRPLLVTGRAAEDAVLSATSGMVPAGKVAALVEANVAVKLQAAEASFEQTITERLFTEWRAPFFDPWYRKGGSRMSDAMRLDAIEQSRRQWTADPLIFRAGEIYKAFVYGRGINRPRLSKSIMATLAKPGEGTIEVEDAEPPLTGNAKKIDDLLTAIWNDPYHQEILFDYAGQLNSYQQLLQDGCLPILVWPDTIAGRGQHALALLDGMELREVKHHPTLPGTFLAYRRDFEDANGGKRSQWYWTVNAWTEMQDGGNWAEIVKTKGLNLAWRGVPKAEQPDDNGPFLLMFKIGSDPTSKYGQPWFYSALNPARSVAETVGNMRTWLRAKARWAHEITVSGASAGQLERVRASEETLIDRSHPRPPIASTLVTNSAMKVDPVDMSDGGCKLFESTAEQCRLQVCAATGIPEHYFGSMGAGKLGGNPALAAELSIVKTFQAQQRMMTSFYDRLVQTCVRMADIPVTTPNIVDVDFPEINSADLGAELTALGAIRTAGGISVADLGAQVARRLGEEDVEEFVDRLIAEGDKAGGPGATALDEMIDKAPEAAAPIVERYVRRTRQALEAVRAAEARK